MTNGLSVFDVDSLSMRADQAAANLTLCIRALSDGDAWREDIVQNALGLVRDEIESISKDISNLPKKTGEKPAINTVNASCDIMNDADQGRKMVGGSKADLYTNEIQKLRDIIDATGDNGTFVAVTTAYYAGVARGSRLAS